MERPDAGDNFSKRLPFTFWGSQTPSCGDATNPGEGRRFGAGCRPRPAPCRAGRGSGRPRLPRPRACREPRGGTGPAPAAGLRERPGRGRPGESRRWWRLEPGGDPRPPFPPAGRVTFQSDPEEHTVPGSGWSVRPFLGYDWIAGLLDTNSSAAEKSDQYFAELHEFRQANKEACIHQENTMMFRYSLAGVYCYRLNQRLFTVPVHSESACPVCKIPSSHEPPEVLEEPACVRVSIPRSTLMPAYKYKAHRRKSFDPSDNLALPSHCLAGWENTVPSSIPTLSSLDLRASLGEKPPHRPGLVRINCEESLEML
uniref:Migration and invasion inhibitory protein n=1 Tax=Calidris pygmaea TaxID=425635 RepID=A0A8C3KBI9_9CHAR